MEVGECATVVCRHLILETEHDRVGLSQAMSYVLAIRFPIAGMSLPPVLFAWSLLLLPLNIVFWELIIDLACSTAFEAEPEAADVMRRPPREPGKSIFSSRNILSALRNDLLKSAKRAYAKTYRELQKKAISPARI